MSWNVFSFWAREGGGLLGGMGSAETLTLPTESLQVLAEHPRETGIQVQSPLSGKIPSILKGSMPLSSIPSPYMLIIVSILILF